MPAEGAVHEAVAASRMIEEAQKALGVALPTEADEADEAPAAAPTTDGKRQLFRR